MKGSISKYAVLSSKRPRWRYRIYAGRNEDGSKNYVGRAGFAKEAEAATAMRKRCILPRSTIEALRLHRERYCTSGSTLLFEGSDGSSHRKPDVVSQTVLGRMRRAEIKKASLHSLRHTHATHLLARGISLAAVSARLGHADPNVTAKIYAHALPPDDRRAADEWEDVLRIA